MKKIYAVFMCVLLIATVCGATSFALAPKPDKPGGGKPGGGDDPPADPAIVYYHLNKGHLAVINADGSNTGIVAEPYFEDGKAKYPRAPSWSPDGKHITYKLWEDSSKNYYSICVLDVNIVDGKPQGSNHRRIATDTWLNFDAPVWSPNGDVIAFVAQIPKMSSYSLWLVNADGTGTPTAIYTVGQNDYIRWPTWNPDGTEIGFIEEEKLASGGKERSIRIFDLETEQTTTVLGPTTDYYIGYCLDWSNDGTKFAFVLDPPPDGGTPRSLYTLDIATKTLTLVEGPRDYGGLGWGLSWSPDDSEIVYSSTPGATGKNNLMSVELSTDKSTMLVRNIAHMPDWRPPTETWPA
jgi:WD40 repeat protein